MSETARGAPDVGAIRAAVLNVMRSCFDPRVVEAELRTLEQVPEVASELLRSVGTPTAAIERVIRRATERLPSSERQAARIMTGNVKSMPASVAFTRADRLNAMAPHLTAPAKSTTAIGQRRVEMIEKEVLIPRIVELMFDDGRSADVRGEPIFGHFVNPEIVSLYRSGRAELDQPTVDARLNRITRAGLAVSLKGLVFPASYVFEVPGFVHFLQETVDLSEAGLIRLTGPIPDLETYREQKTLEYRDSEDNAYERHVDLESVCVVPWEPRKGLTAGQSLASFWRDAVLPGRDLWSVIAETAQDANPALRRRVQSELRAVPERLQGRAFILRHALAALDLDVTPNSQRTMGWLLSAQYVDSYLDDLNANILVDFPWGRMNVTASSRGREVSYRKIVTLLRHLGMEAMLDSQFQWSDLIAVTASLEYDLAFRQLFGDVNPDHWLAIATLDLRPFSVNENPKSYIDRLARIVAALA